MVQALLVVLLYQLLGELIVTFADLPLPGPLIGMALLFTTFVYRRGVPADLNLTSQNLIRFLPVMFVPVGVGVVLHLNRIADEWLAIVVALMLSTIFSVATTSVVMRTVLQFQRRGASPSSKNSGD